MLKDLQKQRSRGTLQGWAALAARGKARQSLLMAMEPLEVLGREGKGGPVCR